MNHLLIATATHLFTIHQLPSIIGCRLKVLVSPMKQCFILLPQFLDLLFKISYSFLGSLQVDDHDVLRDFLNLLLGCACNLTNKRLEPPPFSKRLS